MIKTGRRVRVEWFAEQECGECGEGVFIRHGDQALCTVCEHAHPMDARRLGDMERYEWKHTTQARGEQTLHVVSYIA